MHTLQTSLLREKFVINPSGANQLEGHKPVIALSNRMELSLTNKAGETVERFIVRAHNMHLTIRMCARILTDYTQKGPLLGRKNGVAWDKFWESVNNDFEIQFNEDRWVSVYTKGKAIFQFGKVHPLLDIIENCVSEGKGEYEDVIPVAESLLSKAGKDVSIKYDGNVALVINIEDSVGRFGIILRGADRTTTFNFSVRPKSNVNGLNLSQCMVGASSFLEGIQLAFNVGMNNVKLAYGYFERFSKEEKFTKEGARRLAILNREISNLENAYEIRYRPEKPSFAATLTEAESLAQGIFEPQDKKKSDSDEDNA